MPPLRTFRYPVLPAQPPAPLLARHGMSLVTWPKNEDAVNWRTATLSEALATHWPVDAHIVGYTDLGSEDGRAYRLGVEVLANDKARDIFYTTTYADIDTANHEAWRSDDAKDHAFNTVVSLFEHEAAAVYTTRKGLRVVFELARPIPIALASSWLKPWHLKQAKAHGKALERLSLRWDVSSGEWGRMFRLPYVRRTEPFETEEGALQWPASEESDPLLWTSSNLLQNELTGLTPQSALDAVIGDAPATIPPRPKGWEAWVSASSKAGKVLTTLKRCGPWGPESGIEVGTRNSTLKGVCNSLAAQLFRNRPPPRTEDIYSIVAPCVAAQRTPGGPSLADAWRLAGYAAEAEADRRKSAAVERVTPKAPGPLADPYTPADPGTDTVSATESSEDVTLSTAADGVPGLVYCKGVGYVYDVARGVYTGPYDGADLYGRIQEELDIPTQRGQGGNMIPLNWILTNCGTRANTVEQVYPTVERGGPWTEETRTARVLTFPAPSVPPERSAHVADWLEALLSDTTPPIAAAVLRWLGMSTVLSHPIAALYMEGPPSVGKGVLAAGVAAQWGGAPVTLEEATGRFNAGLLGSPVAFLDEGMEVDKAVSSRLRSIIAERMHRIEGKHVPHVSLFGCIRVLLAGNNPGLLQLIGGHGYRDLVALIGRILHVECSERAALILPKQEALRRWIVRADGTPGDLVRHIAHLGVLYGALTEEGLPKDVIPPGRYLVTGVRSDYHVRLITSDPLFGAVLLAVAVAIKDAPYGGPGITPGAGSVMVNAKALHERWKRLASDDLPRPAVMQLARACEALAGFSSEASEEHGAAYTIPGDFIVRAARDAGFGGLEKLRRIIEHGAPLLTVVSSEDSQDNEQRTSRIPS